MTPRLTTALEEWLANARQLLENKNAEHLNCASEFQAEGAIVKLRSELASWQWLIDADISGVLEDLTVLARMKAELLLARWKSAAAVARQIERISGNSRRLTPWFPGGPETHIWASGTPLFACIGDPQDAADWLEVQSPLFIENANGGDWHSPGFFGLFGLDLVRAWLTIEQECPFLRRLREDERSPNLYCALTEPFTLDAEPLGTGERIPALRRARGGEFGGEPC